MSDDIAAVETPSEIVPETGVIPVGGVDNAPAPVAAETPAPEVATEEVTAPPPSPRPPLAVRAMALEAALKTAHPGSLVTEVIRVALVYEKHLTE